MPKQKTKKPRAQIRLEINRVRKIEIVDLEIMVEGWVHKVVPTERGFTIEIDIRDVLWAKETK